MMDPNDDPRIRGDDIPKYLYKVEPRWGEKSPTSPSIEGFLSTTSELTPTATNHDAFPSTLKQYEQFFREYCDLMNNPVHHDTSTHLHFIGLYTTRFLAEKEVELMRTNELTYRVYCIRGESLMESSSFVVKGRSIFQIGRPNHRETIHTNPDIGEEFLVWGRVPVEAIMGSWGADEKLQHASVRRAIATHRGPAERVPYIETYKELSPDESIGLSDSAMKALMLELRKKRATSSHRQLPYTIPTRTSGAGTSLSHPENMPPDNLSSRSLQNSAVGHPLGLSRMPVQPSTSSYSAQAFQSMGFAPPPSHPSFNSAGRMSLDPRLPQQAPAYRSSHCPLGQMDGSSDEPDDGEKSAFKGPVWPSTVNSKYKIQVLGSNANVRSTSTSSHRPSTTSNHGNQPSSTHTETGASPAIDQQPLSENALASVLAPTPAPATSGQPAGQTRPRLANGRTPLPTSRPARPVPVPGFRPSSDDERAAHEEEEYRRQREGVPRISPAQGAGSIMEAPAQGPSSAPVPVTRSLLPSSIPSISTGGLNPNNPAQTRPDPPHNPSRGETADLASPHAPRSTAPPGSRDSLPQNPQTADGLQLLALGPSYHESIARGIPTSSRDGPYNSPYPTNLTTGSSTVRAGKTAIPGTGYIKKGVTYTYVPAMPAPLAHYGSPTTHFPGPILAQVQQPRQLQGPSLEDLHSKLDECDAKIRKGYGLPPSADRPRPRPQSSNSSSARGRGGKGGKGGRKKNLASGGLHIQEQTKQNVIKLINKRQNEYNEFLAGFEPPPGIFNLPLDSNLPPPNPPAIHPEFENETPRERAARLQYLEYRHTRLEDGRRAYVQRKRGTANEPITFDDSDEEDDWEVEQSPTVSMHDWPTTTPAGGMQNLHQSNFQGPANAQPSFTNSFGPNPYGSRASMVNSFGPNSHNPLVVPNGRGGMATYMVPETMVDFINGLGTQNGPSTNLQPQTALPKPKSEKPKKKKRKLNRGTEDDVNPFA
ncbi:hypothetical protein IFR05_008920 [Cadophora sp. M221]|nr:hypothetical protein IFR05_008920 [Cadophora sp. M221]